MLMNILLENTYATRKGEIGGKQVNAKDCTGNLVGAIDKCVLLAPCLIRKLDRL